MIVLDQRTGTKELETSLLVTAKKLATARGQMIASSRRFEGEGWRSAPFLWPLMDWSEADGK